MVGTALSLCGLDLDCERVELTRPKIAETL
jgi:hypothetical protein